MNIETQRRYEGRGCAICDPDYLPLDLSQYEEVKFPEPFSHTFYFARKSGVFPQGFAFRIRAYGSESVIPGETGILDSNLPCFLEIKHPIKDFPGARRKLRFQTTMKEAITIAASKEEVLEIFGDKVPESTIAGIEALYDSDEPVIPICGVTYERRHFENLQERVTVDANIHPFTIVGYDGNWFIHAGQYKPYSVLEVKTGEGSGEPDISKFRIASPTVGTAIHIEPGMQMKAEGDWVLEERELKIDTIGDPREALQNLESTDELSVGPCKEGSSIMHFIVFGEQGICIMGREGVTEKMAIKYKQAVSSSEGVITRTERVFPYDKEKLDKLIVSLGGNSETVPHSAYFTRERAIRLVTCRKTGNVFAITADRCVSEDGRPDLFQTEIEYRGRIADVANPVIDDESIQKDICRVALHMYQSLRLQRLVPRISSITKYAWIKEPIDTLKTPQEEGVLQGYNAKVEIDEAQGIIRKTYDLWGLAIPPEKLVDNYKKFRKSLQELFSLPEAKIVKQTRNELVIDEELIPGILACDALRDGDAKFATDFIRTVLSSFQGQLLEGMSIDCKEGRLSRCPLKTPVDLKPENFIITSDSTIFFIDPYPPLNREKDGYVVDTLYDIEREHHTWVYGEASVLFTRFLIRCIRANPALATKMTQTVIQVVKELDPSGVLLEEMKKNAGRKKTIADFSEIPNGTMVLSLISTS